MKFNDELFRVESPKGHKFVLKPVQCPHHTQIYASKLRSYKDLPLRMGELGQVHRHEASGALNGLFRVRNFTQDDAHIFITEDQIEEEIGRLIDLFDYVYSVFNLSYHIELSTRPEDKYIGELSTWDKAETALANAMTKKGIKFILNPGDGAFYGPKLDFKLRDSMNRIWQCGTIQLDMNLPERFDLTYVDADGSKKRPIMLHRVVLGSLERFMGILIEHYAGKFPLWLSPVQVKVLPISDKYLDYGKKVLEAGKKAGRIVTGKDTAYEMVNHPTHYNQYDIEVIDMIIRIWGPEAAALWCDITAFKYRMRMGTKPDNSIEQDIKKEQWYLNKSKEIRENLIDNKNKN